MKRIVIITALLSAVVAYAAEQPEPTPAYRSGGPVYVVFEYGGQIAGWNGAIKVEENASSQGLEIWNLEYFAVTKGKRAPGTAAPHVEGYLLFLQGEGRLSWESLAGDFGEWVEPLEGRVHFNRVNLRQEKPFKTVVELDRYYDLSEPGDYNVYWGTRGVYDGHLKFTVLEDAETKE